MILILGLIVLVLASIKRVKDVHISQTLKDTFTAVIKGTTHHARGYAFSKAHPLLPWKQVLLVQKQS